MKKMVLRALMALALIFVTVFALASCDMLPESITSLIGGKSECAHESVEWVVDMEATCKFEGKKHSVCTKCSKVLESAAIPLADHTPGEWEIDYKATCTRPGSKFVKCTSCKRKITTEVIPVSDNHQYDFGSCINCKAPQPASVGLEFSPNGDGTATLIGIGTCTDVSLVIPSVTPAGHTVTSIAAGAFLYKFNLVAVIIPDTVTSAGTNPFTGTSIVRAKVPAAIANAVKGDSLTELIITGTGAIPEKAFASSPNLTSVKIGEGVTEIGAYAFDSCHKLQAVAMPASLTTIGSYAFARCKVLSTIVLGSGVVTIGDYAFNNTNEIKSIVIPASVKYIGIGAFLSRTTSLINKSELTSATFEVTDGWFSVTSSSAINGTRIDSAELADKESAAAALNDVYADSYLKRLA